MFEIGGAFGVVFGVVGLVFAGAGVTLGTALLRRMRWRRQALAHGTAVEARCLETYVSHDRSPGLGSEPYGRSRSTRHAILGFRTQDGQDIRIEDTSGIPRVVGDFVPVRYLPRHPRHAEVAEVGYSGIQIGSVLGLLFCVAFTSIGIVFAVIGLGIGVFDPSSPTDPSTIFPDVTAIP